jgi:hypothetical protein
MDDLRSNILSEFNILPEFNPKFDLGKLPAQVNRFGRAKFDLGSS